ncbi:MAG: molybdopterin-guanine dinucleotide biosynthesis protein B [Deltaproteobacteria bacterium]|nr:molybdopterin-guanine dinucleotide biosynthesis protein B [Deltaproteobacteria bacterium]
MPIISIVGNSGSGKTTLLVKMIPILKQRGFKVGTIKHDLHGFEIDKPGKDSWKHKQAGADTTIISSPSKIGIVKDVDHDYKPEELMLFFSGMDIILTEGYKRGKMPKIEVFRPEICKEPICRDDKNLIGIISNVQVDIGVPVLRFDDLQGIADLVIRYCTL